MYILYIYVHSMIPKDVYPKDDETHIPQSKLKS